MCITFKSFTNVLFTSLLFVLFFGGFSLVAQDLNQAQLGRQYYEQGEIEKAKSIFSKLIKEKNNIPLIHAAYLELLTVEGNYSDAFKYIEKVKNWFPTNYNYRVDEVLLHLTAEDEKKADEVFNDLTKSIKENATLVRSTAQYFFQKGESDYAIQTYLEGRKYSKNNADFAIELANVYRRINNKEAMITEYLNFINQNPNNLSYVQNIIQNLLTEKEDLEALENVLYEKIQKSPDDIVYNELLIWVNMQLKNFYNAFIQARALDKRGKEGGKRLLDIGIMALHNNDYESSARIFEYVIDSYREGFNYEIARRYLIKSREELVKNNFPVEKQAIESLIKDYDKLIQDLGMTKVSLEAMKSKALLHAFYLDDNDTAITLLKSIINSQQADSELLATAKLALGDIYLLTNQPWESTLLYSQVEKSENETPLGYLAKLKNAKLSYYKGDFELAQGHLDVLKLATSREISNDAIALSLLIQDNIAFDTTHEAMRDYAYIDLILFQNKKEEALLQLDSILHQYPGHSLTDEVWWRKANILKELGRFESSISYLDKIVNNYPYDILSDDAYFLMGTILEDYLESKEAAMEIYQSLLKKYPGSVFTSEARKRYRSLRGDFNSSETL